jgi:hypothetical protein
MRDAVGQTIVLCGLPSCARPQPGTGPRPLFCCANQPRLDRIALNILDHFIQLSRRTNPMIVRLILPKNLSASPQDAIGYPAGSPFKPAHNVRHRDMRFPHGVHMVRHNSPGLKVVGMPDVGAIFDGILNHSGDTLVPQPERSRTASVEPLVANVKRNAACVLGRDDLRRARRSGSGESPSYKDNAAIRKPMRKVAAIKHIKCSGRPQKTMVGPTGKVLTRSQAERLQ